MIRNVILDWSGTVVDDLDAVLTGTNAVLAHFGHRELSKEEFRREFVLPFALFYARLLPGVAMFEVDKVYHQSFAQRRRSVKLLDGALDFLEFCHLTGRSLFILSTMNKAHFEAEASRLKVRHYFDQVYVEVPDKIAKIDALLGENNLRAAETLFAGDMIHDIAAGKSGGVLSVAVCTGFDSPEKLAESWPDLMVRDLSSLQRVLEGESKGMGPKAEDEWIQIVDQEVFCRIGVPEEERTSRQRLLVTLRFKIGPAFRSLGDRIEDTVDYAAVAAAVDRIAVSGEMKLIESFAAFLADRLLQLFPMQQVQVSVKKFILPKARWVEVGTGAGSESRIENRESRIQNPESRSRNPHNPSSARRGASARKPKPRKS
jgi:phosphoglycolate phosphatase